MPGGGGRGGSGLGEEGDVGLLAGGAVLVALVGRHLGGVEDVLGDRVRLGGVDAATSSHSVGSAA